MSEPSHVLTAPDGRQVPACAHLQREFLGSDQGANFHRCLRCRTVIVTQGHNVWMVPPAREERP